MSRGNTLCTWSKRLIPKDATGDITLEVPIVDSYREGYIGNEKFWTYIWAKGWCSYSKGYFRCPYTQHDGYHSTSITLPNVEKISYAMLESQYPISIHKAEDESIPGFYVKGDTKLDRCADKHFVFMLFRLNGNRSDVKSIGCYRSGTPLCSGCESTDMPRNGGCYCNMYEGRWTVELGIPYKLASRDFIYCYVNEDKTRAMTYIIDWRDVQGDR
nr:unnamed protein product [Spirometra erinaceieuropaei]